MSEKQLLRLLDELEKEMIKHGLPRARLAPVQELINKSIPALSMARMARERKNNGDHHQ